MRAGAGALALHEQGHTYSQIAKMLGTSRSAVAGLIYRAKLPMKERKPGFRDPERVRKSVALADQIGLLRAARTLGMDAGQLCRWRQALRNEAS